MKCPICKKDVEPGGPYVPFCSDRCRLIDLGNWADGTYHVPATDEPDPEDEVEDREA
jgi:uncharacterized protein